eukprot:29872-Pelagococcus_subviridis.AAC.4
MAPRRSVTRRRNARARARSRFAAGRRSGRCHQVRSRELTASLRRRHFPPRPNGAPRDAADAAPPRGPPSRRRRARRTREQNAAAAAAMARDVHAPAAHGARAIAPVERSNDRSVGRARRARY